MKINVFGRFKFKSSQVLLLLIFFLIFVAIILLTRPSFVVRDKVAEVDIPTEIFKSKNYPAFLDYVQKNGAKKAYSVLKAYFKNNEPDAHDFTHIIGNAVAEKDGTSGIKVCDNFYNYGCYHGFMQIYLKNNGVAAVADMEKSCLDLGAVNAPSCLHGIGHGLMMESVYDLDTALKNCRVLKVESQTYCFDGVFMERIAGSMLPDDKKLQVKEQELFSPCDTINAKYKRECWRNQVSIWFSFFKQDTSKIGSYCAAIEKTYWQICFESIGLINVQNFGEDLKRLTTSCSIVDELARDYCLLGVVKELLFEGKSTEVAFEVCIYMGNVNRQGCFDIYQRMNQENSQRFSKQL